MGGPRASLDGCVKPFPHQDSIPELCSELIKTNNEWIIALNWPCNWNISVAIAKISISFYMFH
jgi:hypothetical protein